MPLAIDTRYPLAIQELWAELSYDVTWLHGRWIIYRQLFGTKKERVDLLNESAGTVTRILQDLLLNDVQLALSMIGDEAGKGNRTNLTLRRLQVDLSNAGEPALACSMEPLITAFETACEKIRHRRNKWLAHSDLTTRLNAKATPLPGPSRKEIENALSALRSVMNCVQSHFTQSKTTYEHFAFIDDGEDLLGALAAAKRYRSLVADGSISSDDLRLHFPKGI